MPCEEKNLISIEGALPPIRKEWSWILGCTKTKITYLPIFNHRHTQTLWVSVCVKAAVFLQSGHNCLSIPPSPDQLLSFRYSNFLSLYFSEMAAKLTASETQVDILINGLRSSDNHVQLLQRRLRESDNKVQLLQNSLREIEGNLNTTKFSECSGSV